MLLTEFACSHRDGNDEELVWYVIIDLVVSERLVGG